MSDSQITKKAIAESLIGLTMKKPFDKISVADITKACNLNRQTFYYHFQDKYELLDWIYYNFTFQPLMQEISFDNWKERLLALLKDMQKNQVFCMNTIKCSEDYFEEYLFKILITLFGAAIESLDTEKKLTETDRTVFARFYAHGLCGIIIDWAVGGMKESIEEMNEHMSSLVSSTEKAAYQYYMLQRG